MTLGANAERREAHSLRVTTSDGRDHDVELDGDTIPGGLGFSGLVTGQGGDVSFQVVEVPLPGWSPTTNPAEGEEGVVGTQPLTLNQSGEIATGVDFGNQQMLSMRIDTPEDAFEGSLVTVTGDVEVLLDGATLEDFAFEWSVVAGNGQEIENGIGLSFGFTPNDNGLYTVRLSATYLGDPETAADNLLLHPAQRTIDVANVAPELVVEDLAAKEGSEVAMESLEIIEPAGVVDTHTLLVSWGDGSAPEEFDLTEFELADITHIYVDEGTYKVTVKATDDDGDSDTKRFLVTVSNEAPVILTELPAVQDVEEGDVVVLAPGRIIGEGDGQLRGESEVIVIDEGIGKDGPIFDLGALFFDAGGLDVHTGTVDWGDKSEADILTLDNGGIVYLAQEAPELGIFGRMFASHVYFDEQEEPFLVTVTLSDTDGGSVVRTFKVQVANAAPTIDGALGAYAEGDLVTLDGLTFADKGVLDLHEATIDWDDGTTDTLTIVEPQDNDGFGLLIGEHVYADNKGEGTYQVTITLRDLDGGETVQTFELSVGNVAPVVTSAIDTIEVDEGDAEAIQNLLVATFTDRGTGDTHTAQVYWGESDDGWIDAVVIAPLPGQPGEVHASHVYLDDGTFTPLVVVMDDDGGESMTGFKVVVRNVAPTVDAGEDATVDELQTYSLDATFTDPGVLDSHFAYVHWGDSDEQELVEVTFDEDGKPHVIAEHAYKGEGEYKVTVTVYDNSEDAGSDSLTVTVKDAAPVAEIGGESSVEEGGEYTLLLSASDPAGDQIVSWLIDWGDGSEPEEIEGNPEIAVHQFSGPPRTVLITATAFDESGNSATDTWTLEVVPSVLQVMSAELTATGVHVRFDRPFDPALLNLYDGLLNSGPANLGPADVTLTGTGGAMRGSLVLDADHQGFAFVRSSEASPTGVLPPDTYTLTLRSAANGFKDVDGALLDGDGDGVAGGAFTRIFVREAVAGPVISIGEFARGPGQVVNVPNVNPEAGIPIRISNAADVGSLLFTLTYNPALLQVNGAVLAPGVTGSLSTEIDSEAGRVQFSVTDIKGLVSTATTLISLKADVPASATYAAKHVLDIQDILANQGDFAGTDDDGLHVVAYLGDATGNARYQSSDPNRIQRVLLRNDTGFAAYQLADPLIIGDVSGDGRLRSQDASLLQQFILRLPVPEIPALPATLPSVPASGPDPTLSMPTGLSARPGDIVTVPVNLDTAAGLQSAQLRIGYDSAALEVVDVRRGTLTGDFGTFLRLNDPGVLSVDVSRLAPLSGGSGSVIEVDFRVRADAAPGQRLIDLEWASLNEDWLTLSPLPVDGPDGSDGALAVLEPVSQLSPSVVSLLQGRNTAAGAGGDAHWALLAETASQRATPKASGATQDAVIDWSARGAGAAFPDRNPASGVVGSNWREDFVGALAREEKDRNPNQSLRVSLPSISKATKGASKLR